MKRENVYLMIALLVISMFMMSACSQKVEMTFFRNGNWRLQNNISYPKSITDLTGGFLSAVGLDLGSSSIISDATQTMTTGMFNLAKNEFRRQGIDMDWEQKVSGNNVVITIDLSADSYNKFDTFISSTGSGYLQPVGSDAYRLMIDYTAMNQQYYNTLGLGELMPMVEMLSMFEDSEVVINAGRIVNSNADRVRGNTAIWYNPTLVDITFVPRSNLRIGVVLIPVISILSIIGISVAVRERNRRSSNEFSQSHQPYNDDFFD